MQFGPNVTIAKPIFILNKAVIEEVKEFKFLGVILTADNISENHIKKRKTGYIRIDGKVNAEKRNERVQKFQYDQ
jgi:hypothetical protein